ncbi:Pao retrotransposon peptidase [Nesidiocoris tenuis]|uniref:Pao retrotransposon peptidase n=1 Tax=Nesidiocoris tenuis TaxID=355587 RepID=A0ABN7AZT9_9HEMI|nr:Pao retrotransposon peptidase [Nesidiocoris tenuis]
MFRQILHRENDRNLLRIVWRFSSDEPIADYRLNTVTYGTSSAPWLANRVIRDIGEKVDKSLPLASDVLLHRIYVDDLNGGADSLPAALLCRDQVISALGSAKLELRKWAANHPDLLTDIPLEHRLPAFASIEIDDGEERATLKILGLCWEPGIDAFFYKLSNVTMGNSKRDLLSQLARVFDPLGWLTPVMVTARIFFREVCSSSIGWDDHLPFQIKRQWFKFVNDLPRLGEIRIPRWAPSSKTSYLVGFADASEKAYAAVVYLVTPNNPHNIVHLILAKSRVAPLKNVTLPRLELCAALLLSRCIAKITPLFPNIDPNRILMFSDSSVALAWITACPSSAWKTFVSNRVSEIVSNTSLDSWFHISSSENPADSIHIEVACDLSTQAFLSCYRNFCARRGNPAEVYSDRGTNFVGASNELRRLSQLLSSPEHQNVMTSEAAMKQTNWHFIPPHAPHFGGLWEAAVKSTKRLLHVTLHGFIPDLEEFRCLVTQIEGVLNSRPICASATSSDHVDVLTPGHFLIFRPLNAPPQDPTLNDRSCLRSRWSQIQQRLSSFWKRWKLEYLTEVQHRYRWNTPDRPAVDGTVVLVMNDDLQPTQWDLGVIQSVTNGPDGVPRVATVRTSSRIFLYPIRKLCPLPSQ